MKGLRSESLESKLLQAITQGNDSLAVFLERRIQQKERKSKK